MSDSTALAPAGRAVVHEHPQVEPSPSARRSWLPGWGPGVVLVAGLGLVAAIVTLADDVDFRALHLLHAEGAQTHVVTQIYVPGWISPAFNPFTDDRLRLLTPLVTLLYLLSVTAIGSPLVGAIRGSETWPRVARLLAGFLPGFLIVLAPLQIVFAATGIVTAAWIALATAPAAAVLIHRRTIAARVAALRSPERTPGAARRTWLGAAGAIAFVVALCAVHRLQAGRMFMVPDSISVFLQAADAQVKGGLGDHLAQWDQQSDEWVFNAPLMFTSHAARDQLFGLWATQAVALASFAALIVGLIYTFAWRHRRWAALLAAGAVLASTPAIYPWDNISLVGGQNPAMWLGHPGRLVGILAPWVALLLLGRRSRAHTAAILLAAAGLGFTTVDGAGYAAVAVVCACAWFVLRGRLVPTGRTARAGTAIAVHALALAALAAPLFVYYDVHHAYWPDNLGWVLVGGAGLGVLAAAILAVASVPRPEPQPEGPGRLSLMGALGRAAPAAAALATGFFLSNNLVSGFADGGVRRALATVLPGFDPPVISRNLVSDRSLTFPSFTGEECSISGHCISFPYFLAAYGFTIVLALAGWLALGRLSSDETVNRRRAAWLIVVAALGLAFAITDFTGSDLVTSWVLTRFIEVPYYAILAFAAVALLASRSRVTLAAGAAVLAAWTIIPFMNSHLLQQWVDNADWLIARMS
jgi:hypothetical protein